MLFFFREEHDIDEIPAEHVIVVMALLQVKENRRITRMLVEFVQRVWRDFRKSYYRKYMTGFNILILFIYIVLMALITTRFIITI